MKQNKILQETVLAELVVEPAIYVQRQTSFPMLEDKMKLTTERIVAVFTFEQATNERMFNDVMAYICNSFGDVSYRDMRNIIAGLKSKDWIKQPAKVIHSEDQKVINALKALKKFNSLNK
jgi:hypothetical protein